jgi:hypothetical protein
MYNNKLHLHYIIFFFLNMLKCVFREDTINLFKKPVVQIWLLKSKWFSDFDTVLKCRDNRKSKQVLK